MFQPNLDIHGIASKAEVYNIEADPHVIEDGFNAACEVIYYLAADGCEIKTLLFTLHIRLPGEYDGAEPHLPASVRPEARLQASASLRKYIRERVRVKFDGVDQSDGLIAEAVNEHTGQVDEVMIIGNLTTIRGYGIKIEADAAHQDDAGLFFDDGGNLPVKAEILAANEPRTLKAIVRAADADYWLKAVTQSSTKGSIGLLKDAREIRSEFKLIAQAQPRSRATRLPRRLVAGRGYRRGETAKACSGSFAKGF
jgi:hypothetical protein